MGFNMKINFCLKLALAAFFVTTQSFAATFCNSVSAESKEEKISPGVQYVAEQYGERYDKFNTDPLQPGKYVEHTHNINRTVKNVDESRHANGTEKELILKAVMANVVTHGLDPSISIFDKTYALDTITARGKHFEILRLTEKLAWDLLSQLNIGSMNIAALAGYEDLYGFSGIGSDIYERWFADVIDKHRPGLVVQNPTLFTQKVDRISTNFKLLQPKKVHEYNEMIEFGDIGKESITKQSVVFVSTYNLNAHQIINNGLFVHLPAKDGRERYIVVENPFFDNTIAPSDLDGSWSPFTIRAHALINGDVQPRTVYVNIGITDGINGSKTIGITNLQGGSVNSHDGRFSPNNMWLTGLDDRSLKAGEVFSFVSRIDGDGKAIDTLHILAYDANSVVNLARDSSNFGNFLQQLSRVHEIFGADTLSHLSKMMAFIVGTI